jgi:hypothetical protein
MRGEPALASRELDQALKIAETQYVEPGFLALLGRVLVRAGRIRDARAVLSRIDRAMKPDNPTDRSARGLMAAELALERGDPKAAYEAIRTDTDQALERWRWAILGRTLEKRGLLDSALAVTAGFSRSFGFGWDNQTDWVMAPLAVARIAEAMADSATARAALQSFLDRWRDADSDLRVLADVRLAIARLQTGANR